MTAPDTSRDTAADTPPVEERFEDGIRVVERRGPSDDSPFVVLVHGVLDSAHSLERLFPRLPEYHLLTYDRRGYGRSAFPADGPRSLAGHAIDLLALLRDRPAVVVGHSMGGNTALCAAHARPDLIRSVSGYEVHAPWVPVWSAETQAGVLAIAADTDPEGLGETSYRRVLGDAKWDALPEEDKRRRRAEGLAYQTDLGTGWETEYAFERATVPTVLGCGERSLAFFVDATRALAETMPATYVEIATAKHAAHITHPADYVAFVHATVDAATAAGR